MREIVLDTETTGLDPNEGHRLVEIGGIELYNCIPTGQVFHRYIDPQRDIPESAYEVHEDDWAPGERYRWREHEGGGYWRGVIG